jgi:hypothetical protein
VSVSLDFNGNANLALLSIAVALFAAGLVWQLNRLQAYLSSPYIVYIAPLAEEFSKTVPAILIGASLFFTHVFFGVIEAVWEWFSQRRNGFYAGLAALASHSIFGFITVLVYERYGTAPPALLAGYLAHMAWNHTVINLVNCHRNR